MINYSKEQRTCPSGHKLLMVQFHAYIDTALQGDESIIFNCPGGKREHSFNIRQAVGCGMLSIEEAFKIVMEATIHRASVTPLSVLKGAPR